MKYRALFAACALLVGVGAQATVVLDDFGSGNFSHTISSGSGFSFQNGSMVGGDRLSWHSISANPLALSHNLTVINGIFSAASKTQVDPYTEVAYGYAPSGTSWTFEDMNLDLSGENKFQIVALSNDQPGTIGVWVRSGTSTSSVTLNLLPNMISTAHTYVFDFSSYSGINFADVDQVVIQLDNTASGDTVLDEFKAVPEPMTMSVLGLAAFFRRRKKKAAGERAKLESTPVKPRNLILTGTVVASLVAAQSASALVVIDDFSTGSANITTSGAVVTAFQNGSMLGGDRMMQAFVSGNTFGLGFDVDVTTGTLAVTSQPGVNGWGKVGYGYAVGPLFDDLNVDLSAENKFEIQVISNDEAATVTIAVRSTQQNPTSLIMVTKSLSGGNVNTPTLLTYNFSEFTGFNFNDVDQILVQIDPDTSGDIAIDEIRAVPEPASMLALAAGGAWLLRRRKRS